jgi:thioredoxin-like negative regulator of GroEL
MDMALQENRALVFFFSSPDCTICKELKPRIQRLLADEFPKIQMYTIEAEQSPEITGQLRVFSFPAVLLFLEGKEYLRVGRYFGMSDFRNDLNRLYSLIFSS